MVWPRFLEICHELWRKTDKKEFRNYIIRNYISIHKWFIACTFRKTASKYENNEAACTNLLPKTNLHICCLSWINKYIYVCFFVIIYGKGSNIIFIIIIIIIIILRYGCLLSQAFSSWYFSWTSGGPHRSGFKLHTAVLSVLCVMFKV